LEDRNHRIQPEHWIIALIVAAAVAGAIFA
jgi:hypothetical protein